MRFLLAGLITLSLNAVFFILIIKKNKDATQSFIVVNDDWLNFESISPVNYDFLFDGGKCQSAYAVHYRHLGWICRKLSAAGCCVYWVPPIGASLKTQENNHSQDWVELSTTFCNLHVKHTNDKFYGWSHGNTNLRKYIFNEKFTIYYNANKSIGFDNTCENVYTINGKSLVSQNNSCWAPYFVEQFNQNKVPVYEMPGCCVHHWLDPPKQTKIHHEPQVFAGCRFGAMYMSDAVYKFKSPNGIEYHCACLSPPVPICIPILNYNLKAKCNIVLR